MDKLDPKNDGSTVDIVQENIEKLKELFPEIFTEGKIDFDALKEVLGEYVDARDEKYSFTWNGKSLARRIAQTHSTGTLRPCPEESVDWDTTQNLFIEGDNLEVLKLLQKSYHKKVKMIYIDPPYNTGNDFIYPDDFRDNIKNYMELTGQTDEEGRKLTANPETSGRYHTDWLNMMYPRLKLARNLLKDDGLIFISIDDNEVSNLRKICDDIFDEINYLTTVIIQSNKRGQTYKQIAKQHEYLLVYYKTSDSMINELAKETTDKSVHDEIGIYELWELRNRNPKFGRHNRPNLYYPIYINPNKLDADGFAKISLVKSVDYYIEVFPFNSEGKESCWRWSTAKIEKSDLTAKIPVLVAKQKKDGGWNIYEKSRKYSKKAKSIWNETEVINEQGTVEIGELNLNGIFDHPKPIGLIEKCLKIATELEEQDIILDFFAGAATTAHALLNLNKEDGGNRKFIIVQLPEPCDEYSQAFKTGYKTIAEIGKERIRRVIKKIKEENPLYQGDLGFKVFKLDRSNIIPWDADFDNLEKALFNAVQNIKPDRKEADVLYEVLLKYGLELTLPIEERQIEGKAVYVIGMGALVICLADKISLKVVEGIARLKDALRPETIRVVFKDSGFADDVVKTNAVQILQQAGINDVKSL